MSAPGSLRASGPSGSERTLFRAILALAWPAMLEEVLATVVQYADAAMVGRLGAHASAAVGLTAPVGWLIGGPLSAAGVGFLACISQSLGAGDRKTARTAASQSVFAVLTLGLALGAITVGISPFLPGWLNGSEEIRADASVYFAIVSAPMLFRAASFLFGSDLRAAGDTRTPMRIGVLMNIINVILNFLLIFPSRQFTFFGAALRIPGAGLGIRGAALASAVSYITGGILMTAALLRNESISPRGSRLSIDKPVMKRCLRVAFPVSLTRIGMGFGYVAFLAQVSSLGTIPLAAHSLAITAEEAVYLPGYGMQAAAATLSGNAVGARDAKKLTRVARLTALLAATVMGCLGALLFFFPGFAMGIFTQDPDVIELGSKVLKIIAVTEPIYAVGIILEGVFNGMGETRMPFVINMCTMWGVRILFTWITVHVLHGSLTQVWLCMAVDNVTRVALLTLRFARGRWKRRLGLA